MLNNLIDEQSIYKTSPQRTILQNLIDFDYELGPLFYNHYGMFNYLDYLVFEQKLFMDIIKRS